MKPSRVLAEFDRWAEDLREALLTRETPDEAGEVLARAREELDGLVPRMADPGWRAPHMRTFSITGAIYVAVYLALAARGCSPAEAWEVCDQATRRRFARLPRPARSIMSATFFSRPFQAVSRALSRRSQSALGGWAYRFVEGEPGAFDYGVDYSRCAIRELAIASGAEAFAPYICLADIPGSEALGWGLSRSETLAQGGERCDFRFRKGGPTEVKVRLPVAR